MALKDIKENTVYIQNKYIKVVKKKSFKINCLKKTVLKINLPKST